MLLTGAVLKPDVSE